MADKTNDRGKLEAPKALEGTSQRLRPRTATAPGRTTGFAGATPRTRSLPSPVSKDPRARGYNPLSGRTIGNSTAETRVSTKAAVPGATPPSKAHLTGTSHA